MGLVPFTYICRVFPFPLGAFFRKRALKCWYKYIYIYLYTYIFHKNEPFMYRFMVHCYLANCIGTCIGTCGHGSIGTCIGHLTYVHIYPWMLWLTVLSPWYPHLSLQRPVPRFSEGHRTWACPQSRVLGCV